MSWTASVIEANEEERYMTLAPALRTGSSALVVKYCSGQEVRISLLRTKKDPVEAHLTGPTVLTLNVSARSAAMSTPSPGNRSGSREPL